MKKIKVTYQCGHDVKDLEAHVPKDEYLWNVIDYSESFAFFSTGDKTVGISTDCIIKIEEI